MTTNDISTIIGRLGLERLSVMQETFVRQAPQAHEALLLAPTGTGKTLAYLLALLLRPAGGTCVVVCPSRELAQQSYGLFRRTEVEVPAVCLTGGHALAADHERLASVRPRLVFGTPGRLLDHLRAGRLVPEPGGVLVVDEYDKCLDEGFADELTAIRDALPRQKDTWLISATAQPSRIDEFIAPDRALRLDFTSSRDTDERLRTVVVPSPEKDKLETLGRLLTAIDGVPTIVFVAHRESADRVCSYLRDAGFAAGAYHGGLEQPVRERNLMRFRCGGTNVLVSTDLAARGIDIPDVGAVVNYHLPPDEPTFCHRNGRSTRWERSGTAYLIVGPTEQVPDFVDDDATRLDVGGRAIRPVLPAWATIYIGRGKKEKLSRGDVAGFLCKKGGLRGDELGRIEVGDHQSYAAVSRRRLKALLKAVAGEKIKGMKTLIEEAR